jgi:hypothetical protein
MPANACEDALAAALQWTGTTANSNTADAANAVAWIFIFLSAGREK